MEMFSTTWLARLFAAASAHVRCIVVCYWCGDVHVAGRAQASVIGFSMQQKLSNMLVLLVTLLVP